MDADSENTGQASCKRRLSSQSLDCCCLSASALSASSCTKVGIGLTPRDLGGSSRHFGSELLGRNGHAGADTLQAVHDNLIASLQTIADDAFSFDRSAEFHGAINDRVVVTEREDEFLILVRADGAIADEQRLLRSANRHANAREEPGNERTVVVRKHESQCERAG